MTKIGSDDQMLDTSRNEMEQVRVRSEAEDEKLAAIWKENRIDVAVPQEK